MRPRPSCFALMFGLLAAVPALADDVPGTTLAPDGQYIYKTNYPSEIASRPLLLPPNMLELGPLFGGTDSNGSWAYAAGVDATYGLSSHWNAGLSARAGQNGFFGGGAHAEYLWTGNFAGHLGADVGCSGAPCNTWTLDAAVGVPVKIKPWSIPLSLRALDTVVDLYVPFAGGSSVTTRVAVPVSAQFNLFPILAVDVGLLTILPIGISRSQFQFAPSAAVVFTTGRFDAGVDARYTVAPGASVTQVPNTFVVDAFLRLRL